MVFESDRRLKLRRAASVADVSVYGSDVHTPVRKSFTLQKIPSLPDMSGTGGYINHRYTPQTSHYQFHRDNNVTDDYWWDRRYYYTPLFWPYTFFGSRRYNLVDGPFSIWWNFEGLNYYPSNVRYSSLENADPVYWRRPGNTLSERPGFHSQKPSRKSHDTLDTAGRAVRMYRQNLIDYDTVEKTWLAPLYRERRSQEMQKLYDPLLFPKYVNSY